LSSTPGDSGAIVNGDISDDAGTYCVIFNSAIAAQNYRKQLVDQTDALSEAYGAIVGNTYPHLTSTASADLGLDSGGGGICPEPSVDQQLALGQKGDKPENPVV
jgi:hypothetical protein